MTLSELLPIATSVLGVLLVMVAGAIAVWFKWLDHHADRSLASLIANVFFPAYFIHKIVGGESLGSINDIWVPPLVGFLTTCLGFGIAWCVVRWVGPWFGITDPKVQRTFALTTGIANYGYIPIPLAVQFFPDAFKPLLIHNIGVDIALWSVGVLVISGEVRRGLKRLAFSLPLWTMILGLAAQQLGLGKSIPEPLMRAFSMLGDCAIPAGLLLGGAIIAEHLPAVRWTNRIWVLLLAIIVRLMILPILFLLIAANLPLTPALDQVLLLQAAMPVATFPIVMTRLFDGDIDTAMRTVLGTSLLGIVSIPLWITVGKWWLGIP